MVFSIVMVGGFSGAGLTFAQQAEIPPAKLEALLQASAELDAFFAAHYRKLERARPEDLTPLQEQLTTEPKAILERHNLSHDDLAQWRRQLETHGDTPAQAIKDPHFHSVVNRLMPRK